MSTTLQRRLERPESEIGEKNQPIMIASMNPDGSYGWDGRAFRNEEELDEAFRAIKADGPLIILD